MSAITRRLGQCSWCAEMVDDEHDCPVMADLLAVGLIEVDATNECVACTDNSLMGFEMATADECVYCHADL